MTTEIETIVKRVFGALDAHEWDRMRELVPANVTCRLGGNQLDREGWIGFSQAFAAGFPDGRHEMEAVHVAGDRAIVSGTYRATHTGAFQGIPASGRGVALGYLVLVRVIDGRPVEMHAQFDSLGLLQQIGALPAQ